MFQKFSFSLAQIVLIYIQVHLAASKQHPYLAEIFVDKCVKEESQLFHNTYPPPLFPYVIISACHYRGSPANYNETTLVKPLPHYSNHNFLIHFVGIEFVYQVDIFLSIYERLIISSIQHDFFRYKQKTYRSDSYPQYDAYIFKLEFLRTRYNVDDITLWESIEAYKYLKFHDDQHPLSMKREFANFKHNNISNLAQRELYHTIQSGYRQQCTHWGGIYDKLGALTWDFNAYDRIFCDAFERYNLQFNFRANYDPPQTFHLRGRMVRDEILSTFPPDTSNALYYASPSLTFVVMKQKPEPSWLFATRPFNKWLWLALILMFGLLEASRSFNAVVDQCYVRYLRRSLEKKRLFAVILHDEKVKLQGMETRYMNFVESLSCILRFLLGAAYGGMILFGILYPTYPWIPRTFKELNATKNYFVATAFDSPGRMLDHLIEQFKVNRVDKGMHKNRTMKTPAEYLKKEAEDELKQGAGTNNTSKNRHAAVMYDDKMNLWMKGRAFIWMTAPFLSRINASEEKVLPEMRYVSVAPGATRMHFLLESIRRAYTAGTWVRWYYLEQNYYKNVAPLIAARILRESGREPERDEEESRPLETKDLFSVFVMELVGLFIAFLVCMVEVYKLWHK